MTREPPHIPDAAGPGSSPTPNPASQPASDPGAEQANDVPSSPEHVLRSPLNESVEPARPGEFAPLNLGASGAGIDALTIDPPVVLAPMAGVTNAPFRTLCRRFSGDRCLYVSEMITARAFVDGHNRTLKLASFSPDERLRSIQLYGTHPDSMGEAAKILANEWGVHHIDLNFGCPVRKVTAAGGGAAIPAKPRLMARLLRAVVTNSGSIPVTVKFRKGIDEDILTYRDAGRVAESEGCQAIALHARTAAQLYADEADWQAIAELKAATTSIPVLGNGDVFECWDALRMMRQTGCDGVVVGRGCLGRPWLFAELVDVFAGRQPSAPPNLGACLDTALEHARLLSEFFGESHGMQQMRKFAGWYTKSFPGVRKLLPQMHRVKTVDDLRRAFADLDRDAPFPPAALRARRCKGGRTQQVSLPQGFLDDREDDRALYADPGQDDASGLSGG